MAAFAHPSQPAFSSSRPYQPIAQRQIPRGACHFRDLTAGRDAFECGCRQFWLNDAVLGAGGIDANPALPAGVWCFCGHHGCFHELGQGLQAPVGPDELGRERPAQANIGHATRNAGEEQQRAIQDGPHTPQARSHLLSHYLDGAPSLTKGLGLFETATGASRQGSPRVGQLNPQNLVADYLPSTQASEGQRSRAASIIGDLPRSSPDGGFRSHFDFQRPIRLHVDPRIASVAAPQEDHSATEIATPSNAGTPVLWETDEAFQNLRTTLEAFNRQHANPDALQRTSQLAANDVLQISNAVERSQQKNESAGQLSRQIASLRMMLSSTPNVSMSIASLNNRLEALETVSFHHIPIEEIYDKFENFDGRILDTEARLEELERAKAVRSGRPGNIATSVDASFDSTMSDGDHLHMNAELFERITAQTALYEQRLRCLEAHALPSVAKPWKVEVVLLPFGLELKGLWCTGSDVSRLSRRESCTPAPSTQSGVLENQVSQAEWKVSGPDPLTARACGPARGVAGLVHDRLRSRGFVKTVTVYGNSAKHMASVVMSAFQEQLPLLEANSKIRAIDHDHFDLLGLQLPFVPLRKVHRSSVLQFLSPAELVTPTLWTADFLHSTVFMRAPSTGLLRLFITTPDAYRQTTKALKHTWSSIRALPRFRPGAASMSSSVAEADALEPCWTSNSRLDPPVNASAHTSMSSALSYHSSFDSAMLSPEQTSVASPSSSGLSSSGLSDSGGLGDSACDEEEDEARGDLIPMSAPQSPITPVSSLFPLASSHSSIFAHERRHASAPHTQMATSFPPATGTSKRHIVSYSSPFDGEDDVEGGEHPAIAKSAPLFLAKRRRISRSPEDVETMDLWNLTPRRSREPGSPYFHPSQWQTARRTSRVRTPSAYATPYSADVAVQVDRDAEDEDEGGNENEDKVEEDEAQDDADYEDESASDEDDDDDDAMIMGEDVQFAQSQGRGIYFQDGDTDADEDEGDIWEGMEEEEEHAAETVDHEDRARR